MLFFLLINVKMPTIVGILTFISRKNFMLNSVEHEKSFITSGPGLAHHIFGVQRHDMEEFHCRSAHLLLWMLLNLL